MRIDLSCYFLFINPYNILLFASLIGGIIVSILITKKNEISSFFLAFFYSIISLFFLQTYIIDKGLLNEMKWFYGWPSLFYSLMPFIIYAYLDSCIKKKFEWKLLHLFLLLPWLLSIINVLLFYFAPLEESESIIRQAVNNPNDRFKVSYGILTLQAHSKINYFFNIISLICIYHDVKKYSFSGDEKKNDDFFQKWIFLLWGLLMFFSLMLLFWSFNINNFIVSPLFKKYYSFFQIGFSIICLLLVIIPIYHPKVLYGIPQIASKKKNKILAENVSQDALKYNLNIEDIKLKLLQMEESKRFTDANFDLSYLSNEFNLPTHHLSYFFNNYYGVSFSVYRNNLRMEYAIVLLKDDFVKDKTFESLALQCGFISRTSFSRSFRNYTGMNIKEFASKMGES